MILKPLLIVASIHLSNELKIDEAIQNYYGAHKYPKSVKTMLRKRKKKEYREDFEFYYGLEQTLRNYENI